MNNLLLLSIGKTVFAYLLLLLLTRLMGRKSVTQMTFFDFTVGIMSG